MGDDRKDKDNVAEQNERDRNTAVNAKFERLARMTPSRPINGWRSGAPCPAGASCGRREVTFAARAVICCSKKQREGDMVRVWAAALAALMVIGSATAALAGDAEECLNTKIGSDTSASAAACTRLAEKGEGWAQCYLGFLYTAGHGVPKDHKAATEWYRKAAEQGEGLCQLLVGLNYVAGEGVPRDYVKAYMWLELAAVAFPQGSNDAQQRSNHDQAVKHRDIAASKMTQAQIAEAQRLAREWKPMTNP